MRKKKKVIKVDRDQLHLETLLQTQQAFLDAQAAAAEAGLRVEVSPGSVKVYREIRSENE
jgi:hypothetical protein